jgi:hypothetical protein
LRKEYLISLISCTNIISVSLIPEFSFIYFEVHEKNNFPENPEEILFLSVFSRERDISVFRNVIFLKLRKTQTENASNQEDICCAEKLAKFEKLQNIFLDFQEKDNFKLPIFFGALNLQSIHVFNIFQTEIKKNIFCDDVAGNLRFLVLHNCYFEDFAHISLCKNLEELKLNCLNQSYKKRKLQEKHFNFFFMRQLEVHEPNAILEVT